MTDFAMLDQVLDDFNDHNKEEITEKSCIKIIECIHENTIKDKDRYICDNCGEEVIPKTDKSFDKFLTNRNKLDPNRCQIRKPNEKTIYKDVEKMNFSEAIITEANKIFLQVTKGAIYRGNSRRAIIFACVFHAYKISGAPQSCE